MCPGRRHREVESWREGRNAVGGGGKERKMRARKSTGGHRKKEPIKQRKKEGVDKFAARKTLLVVSREGTVGGAHKLRVTDLTSFGLGAFLRGTEREGVGACQEEAGPNLIKGQRAHKKKGGSSSKGILGKAGRQEI